MNQARLDLIPDRLLSRRNTDELREWLDTRGWSLSLLELDTERRRRGVGEQTHGRSTHPATRTTATDRRG